MTSFVFISSSSATPQTLAAGETGFVGEGQSLYTTTSNGVTINGNASLTAMGSIIGDGGGSAVALGSLAQIAQVAVGRNGTILSTTAEAITGTVVNQFFLNNAGLIAGNEEAIDINSPATAGIFADHYITNTGIIQSNSSAASEPTIRFATPNDGVLKITNSGQIMNGGNGGAITLFGGRLELSNAGTIQSDVDAACIVTADSSDELLNSGEILGQIDLRGNNDTLQNTGTIIGQVNMGVGADFLDNTGTIRGDVLMGSSETTGVNDDVLLNSGLIDGSVFLSGGNDTFVNTGGRVTGTIDGGDGGDQYTIDRTDLIVIDTGNSGEDQVTASVDFVMQLGIERLSLVNATGLRGTGNVGSDLILGSDGDDTIRGGEGNDSLAGDLGDDRVFGGRGDDSLIVNGDDDVVHGGLGNDLFSIALGNATLDGGNGIDTLSLSMLGGLGTVVNLAQGTASSETVGDWVLSGIENVAGNNGSDTITGSSGANLLTGNGGADVISGGSGGDTIVGGAGSDTMAGGGSADVFVFGFVSDSPAALADLITDFSRNADRIDLSAIDADGPGIVNAFTFVGAAAFNGAGPQVRFTADSGAGLTTIEVRLAGSGTNDMVILMTGAINLTADNFIL